MVVERLMLESLDQFKLLVLIEYFIIISREKSKAEEKDKKILELVRSKDSYILQLQEVIFQS